MMRGVLGGVPWLAARHPGEVCQVLPETVLVTVEGVPYLRVCGRTAAWEWTQYCLKLCSCYGAAPCCRSSLSIAMHLSCCDLHCCCCPL